MQVDVPAAEVELAADALWQAEPSAVSEVGLANGFVRLTADVARPLVLPDRWAAEALEVDGDDYLDAWRAFAQPVQVSRRLVVQPPWVPAMPGVEDDLVILIDPGRAFGSGAHPATRLALEAVEAAVRAGDRVLDIGCGSGVLAIGAAMLGASEVTAVDLDPAAVDATRANAERNGVGTVIRVALGSTEVAEGPGDVVVANIGVAVLRELAGALAALVRPGGVLVLSGLLEGQDDEVVASLRGCDAVAGYEMDGWVAPVLRRVR